MCGIAGILRIVKPGAADAPPDSPLRAASGEWLWHGPPIDPEDVPRASAADPASHWLIDDAWLDALDRHIAWRGPDGAGRFRDRVVRDDGAIVEVALVHRRLSIIDIEGGAQPMIVSGCPKCANRQIEQGSAAQDDEAKNLLAVVFNGCVYNHRRVRAFLESRGHMFATSHSDTEVLPHMIVHDQTLYEQEASSSLAGDGSIDGMAAYAVWDRAAATLITARDGQGEKPLYFWRDEDRGILIFASVASAVDEARRLLEHDTRNPTVRSETSAVRGLEENRDAQGRLKPSRARDETAAGIAEYLHLGFNTRRLPLPLVETDREVTNWGDLFASRRSTPAQNAMGCLAALGFFVVMIAITSLLIAAGRFVLSLIPASILAVTLLKIVLGRAAFSALRNRPGSAHTALKKDTVEHALRDAVIARLDADVPLGCFLSGGIDSSLIASLAREAMGQVLETFSMRMPEESYDESRHAEKVARHLGTRHVTFDCDATSASDDLVHLISLYGLPFGDSSILPAYWLCRGTREHVKVALSGEGGDELFHGYDRHRTKRYFYFWNRPFFHLLRTSGLDLRDPTSRDSRKYRLIQAARHAGYTDLLAVFPTADLADLIGPRWARGARPRMGDMSPADFDRAVYLEGDLLRKTDLASMAVGLEVRCPFLSMNVAMAAGSIPARLHTSGGVGKAVLRDIARRRGLPEEIVTRKKQGFAIPISHWFRTDFGGLRALLLDHLRGERPFGHVHDLLPVNMDCVRRLIDEHWAAGGLPPIHTTRAVRPRDHGQRLFTLLTLAIWARQQ